jgi:type IV pilus assembly protein PilW
MSHTPLKMTSRGSIQSMAANRCAHRGFTLVELMIAILIGLFLVGGLLTLVQALKSTMGSQTAMSELQDSERVAMSLMSDVIQSAGYFPNPQVIQAANAFPIVVPYTFAGQSVIGAGGYFDVIPDQTITVRYATSGTDGMINCTGNVSLVAMTFVNEFSLQADPSIPGTYDLMCTMNGGNPVPLVSGITNLQIYYGVQTNPAVSNNSADTYLDAATVTADNYWANVISVKVKITFVNPMYGNLAGQTRTNMPQFIPFERVIAVMNKTGVST